MPQLPGRGQLCQRAVTAKALRLQRSWSSCGHTTRLWPPQSSLNMRSRHSTRGFSGLLCASDHAPCLRAAVCRLCKCSLSLLMPLPTMLAVHLELQCHCRSHGGWVGEENWSSLVRFTGPAAHERSEI
jgi:hypothetical protein